jgi:hypothetical protein
VILNISCGFAQDLEKFSKKELKELAITNKRQNDSLLLLLHAQKKDIEEKDSLLKDLNEILVQIEQKLTKIEFESSVCRSSRDSLKINLINKEKEVSLLSDSINKNLSKLKTNYPKMDCVYKEEKIPDCDFPVSIKSCNFGPFKSIKTSTPDFNGNYGDSYDLFKKVNGKYISIKNSEIFNDKKMELLEKINISVKQNFDDFLNGPFASDCFENASSPNITFDDLSIQFADEKIEFIVKFSISFLCFSEKSTTIPFRRVPSLYASQL